MRRDTEDSSDDRNSTPQMFGTGNVGASGDPGLQAQPPIRNCAISLPSRPLREFPCLQPTIGTNIIHVSAAATKPLVRHRGGWSSNEWVDDHPQLLPPNVSGPRQKFRRTPFTSINLSNNALSNAWSALRMAALPYRSSAKRAREIGVCWCDNEVFCRTRYVTAWATRTSTVSVTDIQPMIHCYMLTFHEFVTFEPMRTFLGTRGSVLQRKLSRIPSPVRKTGAGKKVCPHQSLSNCVGGLRTAATSETTQQNSIP